ncbi:hypothetical protein H4696_001013 [Amycolatopsis lexingtonensis]|uniref:Uncharacterized protein n=1 Tax=Amycolatopsis lexingtonensis TaxID=218822 RepID=A0ABR9HSL2_9PSEU|nr:hypothetical protein [Amycolatopsis lexingtonensis]MBE1493913.1 hypothetical protein [Amycolatopsis lexingtonensis]
MHPNAPFAHAENTAHKRPAAWPPTVRERLTIKAAVRFAARLPGPRGGYRQGRSPSPVPARCAVPGFVAPLTEVRRAS